MNPHYVNRTFGFGQDSKPHTRFTKSRRGARGLSMRGLHIIEDPYESANELKSVRFGIVKNWTKNQNWTKMIWFTSFLSWTEPSNQPNQSKPYCYGSIQYLSEPSCSLFYNSCGYGHWLGTFLQPLMVYMGKFLSVSWSYSLLSM